MRILKRTKPEPRFVIPKLTSDEIVILHRLCEKELTKIWDEEKAAGEFVGEISPRSEEMFSILRAILWL
jgi:hypothetical protein